MSIGDRLDDKYLVTRKLGGGWSLEAILRGD
jgi:hypothetical protein